LKSEHRITARDFILFAQQHSTTFASSKQCDHWLHPDKMSMTSSQKKELYRGVTREEEQAIKKKSACFSC
jgi:hypothetical protein